MAKHSVIAVSDLALNQPYKVILEDIAIVVVKDSSDEVHALGDTCTHGDISLSEGFVEEDTIECWAHGSAFSLKTGIPRNLPAYEPVPVFEVEIIDGHVFIDPQLKKEITND